MSQFIDILRNPVLRVFMIAVGTAFLMIGASPHPAQAGGQVNIYFFYGEGCPHCERERPFLEYLARRYPEVTIKSYEVWNDPSNGEFYSRLAAAYGLHASGVPATFIGDFGPVVGWSGNDETGRIIEGLIRYCIDRGCPDPSERLKGPPGQAPVEEREGRLNIPLIGTVDPSKMAIPVLTIVLGALDSFNPCAFFVLFTLLGLIIHAGTRRRMMLVGGIFVFFSGLIYFLFMAAWLNLFLYMGELKAVTFLAGVVAVLISLINIKEFFFFRQGLSLTIPDGAKHGLFTRMRGLLKATSTASVIFGTVILAAAANTYELICTSGFPMIFTRILTLQGFSTHVYYMYLALYNLVYVIPLAVIVSVFTLTLGTRKMTEWEGRVLKLLSGTMMLFLGLVLLIKPALLNNLVAGVGLLLTAAAVTAVIAAANVYWKK